MSPPPIAPYDLRIGVTGHRNLAAEERPRLQAAVDQALDHVERVLVEYAARPATGTPRPKLELNALPEWVAWCGERVDAVALALLRRVWPAVPRALDQVPRGQQTPFRWVVVSPLAEGADQLVAERVLQRAPTTIDPSHTPPRLDAVLPMALEKYRVDFTTAEVRDHFERLLARAATTNEADRLLPTDVEPGPRRDEAYQLAGHAVVNRCDVLVALWDGHPAGGTGGTQQIVQYAIDQGRPVIWIYARREGSPVDSRFVEDATGLPKIQFLVPAPPEPRPKWLWDRRDSILKGAECVELPRRAKDFSLGFHRLSAFHRDRAVTHRAFADGLRKMQDELGTKLVPLGRADIAPKLGATILPPLAWADLLAQHYQRLYRYSAAAIYLLALLAITIGVAQHVFHLWHELIVGEFLALLAAWGLLRVLRREKWREKFLNDRYVAEWLRRAQFLALLPGYDQLTRLGLAPRAKSGPPALYHGPETWFVDAWSRVIADVEHDLHGPGDRPLATEELLQQVMLNAWIKPQIEFHENKAERAHARAEGAERITFALFLLTLTMVLLHLVVHDESGHHVGANLVTVLAILLPAVAAALHAIERLLDHERTTHRSGQMARRLKRLATPLRTPQTPGQLNSTIRDIDAQMALEVQEWWIAGDLQQPGHPV
ncbi:MAG: hypothetical protein K1X74_22835 [Pirellulales bacterium]|nr:hypothetical protein [Pirellulales bacterium]